MFSFTVFFIRNNGISYISQNSVRYHKNKNHYGLKQKLNTKETIDKDTRIGSLFDERNKHKK